MLVVAVATLVIYRVELGHLQLWGWTLAGTAVAAAVSHTLAPAVRAADISGLGIILSIAGFLWLFMGMQGFHAIPSDATPVSTLGNLSGACCLLRLSNAHYRARTPATAT
jgi:hypothetical protein